MAIKTWGRTALTGGASGALDELDADNLIEGMRAITVELVGDVPEAYEHRINAASGAAEASPDVIKPDSGGGVSPYAGDKRWELVARGKLVLTDTDASHKLEIKWNEDDNANRVLNLEVNGADATLSIEGSNAAVNQDLTSDASPAFAGLTISSLINKQSSESVNDEAEITLATGVTGWGVAQAGDNEEWIQFSFTAAGVVTVIANSANAVNTDTDGNLCVYDAGAGIAIKNRLGAAKTIRYVVNYSA